MPARDRFWIFLPARWQDAAGRETFPKPEVGFYKRNVSSVCKHIGTKPLRREN